MTLNLMLTCPSAVFLSGDFRLTYKVGKDWKDDFNVQKLIPVFKLGWSALISFSGIAKLSNGIDVGTWVAESIHTISMHASFDELPKRLLTASNWLRIMRDPPPLTFSVVGFIRRHPIAMMISNCQDIDGNFYFPALPNLKVSSNKPKVPQVRIAGDLQAVTSSMVSELKQLISNRFSPRQVQAAMALANADASNKTLTISRQCVTGHLLPSGSAEVTPHEIVDNIAYLPDFVIRDLAAGGTDGFVAKLDKDNKPLPPIWVGMTARVQKTSNKHRVVAVLHALRNVGEPLQGEADHHWTTFWKIVGKDEPDHYTFTFRDG